MRQEEAEREETGLAEEARRQVEQHAQEIRKTRVPMETEPAAIYRP